MLWVAALNDSPGKVLIAVSMKNLGQKIDLLFWAWDMACFDNKDNKDNMLNNNKYYYTHLHPKDS